MIRGAALLALLLMVTGCGFAPLNTRAACDEIRPILREFGQQPPNQGRYGMYWPKIEAVLNRSDDTARQAIMPLVDVMREGATVATPAVMFKMAGVNIGIQYTCKAAGSTTWG